MLKIVISPHSILSQSAKQITKVDKSVLKLIKQMKHALEAAKDPVGVGLAAPQIGKALQIFIIKPTEKSNIQVFINPKINSKLQISHLTTLSGRGLKLNDSTKEEPLTKLEGCLSLPNIWGNVVRNSTITVTYLDENNKSHTRKFKGFITTIIQHEMDHLDGILFPKRVLEQKGKLYKSHKDEKSEDVFEEIEI